MFAHLLTFLALISIQSVLCTHDNKCSRICTLEYNPVCGFCESENTFSTFGNQCQLRVANNCDKRGCQLRHLGECQDSDYCHIKCPQTDPVCAVENFEYRYFSSECDLKSFNKCKQRNFRVTKLDDCRNPPSDCEGRQPPSCISIGGGCFRKKDDSKNDYEYIFEGQCVLGEHGCTSVTYYDLE